MCDEKYEQFLNEVQKMVTGKVSSWWSIVDKIGIGPEEMDTWCNIFKAQIEDVCNDMVGELINKQDKLVGDIEDLLKKSEDLCKQLHLKMPDYGADELHLYQELKCLKEKVQEYEVMIAKQQEEINILNEEETKLCEILGRKTTTLPLSPLPQPREISDFKTYLENLEHEKFEREEFFIATKSSIIDLAKELKYKPTLDFERNIIAANNYTVMISDNDISQLRQFYDSLKQSQANIIEEIDVLREKVNSLWDVLSENLVTCRAFLEKYSDNNYETLDAYKTEIKRCDELKMANIEKFVKRLRDELTILWDKCHFTEEERNNFEYFQDSLFTEDLLSLHDIEIKRLKNYYATNNELFTLLEKHSELWSKMTALDNASAQPNRYKNRGGQLLKEEKERNMISKQIPKIEEQLLDLARNYELKNGKTFTSWGKSIDTLLANLREHHQQDKKLKLNIHKQNRDKAITPTKSVLGMTQTLSHFTPRNSTKKRKITTPALSEKRKCMVTINHHKVPNTAPSKLIPSGKLVDRCRYSIEKAKRLAKIRRNSLKANRQRRLHKDNSIVPDYCRFEEGLDSKENCRSTLYIDDSDDMAKPLPLTPNKNANSPHPSTSKISTWPQFRLNL